MKEINGEKYHVTYDSNNAVVLLQGAFLLNGAPAYEPILKLLQLAAVEQTGRELKLDISGLLFLNSSGINMMTRFVMYISEINPIPLTLCVQGQKQIAWQERLVLNLQRLMPEVQADLR
jgi:hypothetical protein